MKPLSGRTQTVESWKLSCPGAVSTAWQVYRRNSLKKEFTIRLEDDDPYLQAIRDRWGGAIHKAFHDLSHDPGLTF